MNMLFKLWKNERGDSTTVLFTTLNMVLLAFFIVLNSLSVKDDNRSRKALGSFLGTVGILPGGLSPSTGKGNNTVPPSSELQARNFSIMEFIRKLEKFSLEKDIADEVILNIGKDGVLLILSGDLAFEKGKAEISPKAQEIIQRLIPLLVAISGEINIIGHASQGGHKTGDFPNEATLSIARSGNTARLLIGTKRIKAKRLAVSGYGYGRPIFGGKTPLREKFKDRIEIVLKKQRLS